MSRFLSILLLRAAKISDVTFYEKYWSVVLDGNRNNMVAGCVSIQQCRALCGSINLADHMVSEIFYHYECNNINIDWPL